MAGINFSWTQGSPDQIARTIHALAQRAPDVVADVAASEALRAEAHMKDNARWMDRTGNARQGLFGASERTATGAIMALGGTMDYQPWLELGTRRMAPRSIITPTWRLWSRILPEQAGKALMEMFAP